jgi:uncharacterized cupin superfamily protein
MPKRVMNIDEADWFEVGHGAPPLPGAGSPSEKFQCRMAQLAAPLGAEKLGYNITAVPPGKRAFPFHSHRNNEEMFFILEGAGEVRIGEETWPLRRGDVIACPPGDGATAHQIVNTGDGELKYLAVSTRLSPEVVDYPDSGKFGVMVEAGRSPQGRPLGFRFLGRPGESLPYWEGE